MDNKNNCASLLNIIFSVMQDLYVYCHLKNYDTDSKDMIIQDEAFAAFVMTILITLFSFTMIKVLAIFLYFFVVNIIVNIGKFFVYLFTRGCQINLASEVMFSCYYLIKITKKMYTYNFYSYENKVLGFFLVMIYLIFIVFNIVFAAEYMTTDVADPSHKPESVKVIQMIAFELSIIMELICCSFYITRSIKRQFAIILTSYLFLNGVVAGAVLYKLNQCDDNDEKPRRIANLVFLVYFSVMFMISLIKVCRYDLNLEAWKCLLLEKQKFYSSNGNEVAFRIINDEREKLNEISTKIKLRNVYEDASSNFFFKKKDRFYHRKKIILVLSFIFMLNMTEFGYTIVRLVYANNKEKVVQEFRLVQKFFSCLHMINLILLSWFAFLKLEIKTVTLY